MWNRNAILTKQISMTFVWNFQKCYKLALNPCAIMTLDVIHTKNLHTLGRDWSIMQFEWLVRQIHVLQGLETWKIITCFRFWHFMCRRCNRMWFYALVLNFPYWISQWCHQVNIFYVCRNCWNNVDCLHPQQLLCWWRNFGGNEKCRGVVIPALLSCNGDKLL